MLCKMVLRFAICMTLIVLSTSQNQEYCPEIKGCSNCKLSNFIYSIECPLNEKIKFTFRYVPYTGHLTVRCSNGTTLDRLHINDKSLFEFITKLEIENCYFQDSTSLDNFTQKLGIDKSKLEEIILSNITFISPLIKEHFSTLTKTTYLTIKNSKQSVNHTSNNLSNNKLLSKEIIDTDESWNLANDTFQVFNSLTSLSLQNLNLKQLHYDSFSNLINLTILDLSHNKLKTLENKLFERQRNLIKLSLPYNLINHFNKETFKNLKNLEMLNLAHNNLTRIPSKSFNNLVKLKYLNLARNRISVIDHNVFINLKNLKVLDLSYNNLELLDPFRRNMYKISVFRYCISMVELILHHNKIKRIYTDWLHFKDLRVLDLQNNAITEISSELLAFKSIDVYLNLMHNHIRTVIIVPESLTSIMDTNPDMVNVLVDFSFNPIHCDCELYNFMRYFENKLMPDIKRVFHFVAINLKCNSPTFLKGELMSEVQSKGLMCIVANNYNNNQCVYFWSPEFKIYLEDCKIKSYNNNQFDLRLKEHEATLLNNHSDKFLKEIPLYEEV